MFKKMDKYFNYKEINKPGFSHVPFFVIAFVIPLIMFPVTTQYNNEMKDFLLTQGIHTDYYQLIKTIALYLSTLLLLPVLIFNIRKNFPFTFLILVPVYISSFLSTYLSDFKISALFGIFDQYEGFITLTCYLLLLICAYSASQNIRFIYSIIKIALWAGFSAAIIGIFQYIGLWPFITEEPYSITSTIGNSNYVGTYSAMILPLSLTLLLLEEKLVSKIICLLFFFGSSFFLLLGSLSRAALIAFFIIIPLYIVLLGKEIRSNAKLMLAAAVYGIVLFTAMNIYSGNSLVKELVSLNPFNAGPGQKLIFEDIKLSGNSARIDTDKWQLDIEINENGYVFRNESGKDIPFEFDKENNVINIGPPYEIQAFIQEKEDLKWIMLSIDQRDIELVCTRNSLKVVGFNGMLTDIRPAESVGLPFGESFASGRGYIWSRTIPLLKDAVFTGYGPDTFVYVFPQNDIVGKLNYGAIWTVISKPHNWYLQTALGSGVLSLICLLIFFIWYGINVIKENRKKDNKARILSCGLLLSVTGYLISGIFNDSAVSVSPIFWMLLGFGISINRLPSASD